MMMKPNNPTLYVNMRISAGYCPCWNTLWLWLCLLLVENALRSASESVPSEDPPLVKLLLPNPAARPFVPRAPSAADSLLQLQSSRYTSVHRLLLFFFHIFSLLNHILLSVCLPDLERYEWKENVRLSSVILQKLIAAKKVLYHILT